MSESPGFESRLDPAFILNLHVAISEWELCIFFEIPIIHVHVHPDGSIHIITCTCMYV